MRRWVIEYGWFLMMGLIITALGFIAYEVHQANRHSADNNAILNNRTAEIQAIRKCACGEGR